MIVFVMEVSRHWTRSGTSFGQIGQRVNAAQIAEAATWGERAAKQVLWLNSMGGWRAQELLLRLIAQLSIGESVGRDGALEGVGKRLVAILDGAVVTRGWIMVLAGAWAQGAAPGQWLAVGPPEALVQGFRVASGAAIIVAVQV